MITKYAMQYTGYMSEQLAAVGSAVDALDLTATTERFWSSGPLEPIEGAGQGPKYTVQEIDVPEWLTAGIAVAQRKGSYEGHTPEYWAVSIILGHIHSRSDLYRALSRLVSMRGKFADSLRQWWATRGELTTKQISAVCNPPRNWR